MELKTISNRTKRDISMAVQLKIWFFALLFLFIQEFQSMHYLIQEL